MSERNSAIRCFHHWPTRCLCVFLILLQAASMNWYLMQNLSFTWAAIYVGDAVVVVLFISAIIMSSRNINKEKHATNLTADFLRHLPLMYISWFIYAALLDAKTIIIFSKFSTDLDDETFFGPNTLRTTIGLSGLVFLTFLPTQHDVKSGARKAFIVSLTATISFDILDGVDILDNLFDKDIRDSYPPALDDAMIALFCVNLLLTTVPLFTLAYTKFALHPLAEKVENFHKLALAYLVNFPLFVIRMVHWHGLSQGISIFLLKNIIAMGVATFEVCEYFFCMGKEEEEIKTETSVDIDDSMHITIHPFTITEN